MNLKHFTSEEIVSLFNVCDCLEHRTAFALGLDTGGRVGEIVTLDNIPQFTKLIQIRDSKSENETKKKGKTKRSPFRECTITQPTLNLLHTFKNQLKEQGDKRAVLFPYSERTLNRWVKFYCQKAGIIRDKKNHIRWHCLRHTFIQRGIDNGIPLKIISQQTGDSIFTLLRYYNDYSIERRIEIIESRPIIPPGVL